MKRIILTILGGAALAVILWSFVLIKRGRPNPAVNETVVVRPVPTAVAQASATEYIRVFPGKVRANQRIELSFSNTGLLELLNAEEGSTIRQGELIAGLDQRDCRYALDIAEARFENARRELARYTKLYQQKAATEIEYENAKTTHDIARAELSIRRKALQDTQLHAPFDGIIVKRHVEKHQHIRAKEPVVSFQDISLIEVIIQIPEKLIARNGTDIFKSPLVCFDTDGERWFEAAVGEYSGNSNSITQTYDLAVVLTSPPDLNILPGMTATVQLKLSQFPGDQKPANETTRIPVEALCRGSNGQSYVWVIDPDGGNPERIPAEPANLYGGYVDIRSALRPGQHVAVAGLHVLREDIFVRPALYDKEGLDG